MHESETRAGMGQSPLTRARSSWLTFALATTVLWGLWGALTGLSSAAGIPETMIYIIWSLTMIPPALFVLARSGWQLDMSAKAVGNGLAIGLLGAGGQLILFHAVSTGPAYLIFPIISLSPAITILLSLALLGERTTRLGTLGIVLALVALPLFDFSPQGLDGGGLDWFLLSIVVMLCWGLQAYFLKHANNHTSAESIFVYMTIAGLILTPVAWIMTGPGFDIGRNWPVLGYTAAIQSLNAIGALTLVFAFRYGKAILVAPLTNAGAPLMTAVLALFIAGAVPGPLKSIALVLSLIAAALLAFTSEKDESDQLTT